MSDYTPTNRQSLDRMIRDYGRERVDVRPASGKLGGHDVFVDGQWSAWMWAIGPARETNAWDDREDDDYPYGKQRATGERDQVQCQGNVHGRQRRDPRRDRGVRARRAVNVGRTAPSG